MALSHAPEIHFVIVRRFPTDSKKILHLFNTREKAAKKFTRFVAAFPNKYIECGSIFDEGSIYCEFYNGVLNTHKER